MGKCEYSQYRDGSDRCVIKGNMKGMDNDKVNSDTYKEYCRYESGYKKCPFYEAKQKESSSGGCFLTSACVRARGLADDCEELQTLRAFRDGWLKDQPYGPESIREYYRIAPAVVESIDASSNAVDIYNAIFERVILPCIRCIQAGRNGEAFDLYKSATAKLAEKFS